MIFHVTIRRLPVKMQSFAYLLDSVGDEINFARKILKPLAKMETRFLLIAMSKLLNQTSLKNLNHVLDDSFLPEIHSLRESFSSLWLSDFLESLSCKDAAMTSFYNSLIGGED